MGLLILGCGWIAHRHARAAYQLRRDVALMFASRDQNRAERYRQTYGGVAAFGSYADAIADPRVHAAVVCTPHAFHRDNALLAASAGKHLLVEKPLARSLDEADQIIEAAEAHGVTLMVAENFRFMPAFRRVERYVRTGWLGSLREIQLSARGYRIPTDWRLLAAAMGGGTLIDGGIHYITLLNQWAGDVERVFAMSPLKSVHEIEGEDSVVLMARLAGGAVATLSNSLSTPGCFATQWATVSGAKGSLYVDNRGRFLILRSQQARRLHLYWRDRRGHTAMLKEFLSAIREKRAPSMDGRAGRRDLGVVLAAYRSIKEERPVEVET